MSRRRNKKSRRKSQRKNAAQRSVEASVERDGTEQNETDRESISIRKLNVLELLISGCTVTEAASLSGIGRSTIYRWLQADDSFLAEMKLARLQRFESYTNTVESMVGDALATVRAAIKSGDLKAAIWLLDKLPSLISPESFNELPPPPSVKPEVDDEVAFDRFLKRLKDEGKIHRKKPPKREHNRNQPGE